ncbi:MAG: transglycosylase SLT domain-containing protein [candidate division WOR-3 bacterium]|nr:MAG: transglycosylase SLT domain-containing protein [candidate division WOR-3 bacterium]
MRWVFFVILLIISCPRPGIKKISEPDYLKEALRSYYDNPLYAYTILTNNVVSPEYKKECAKILVKIYFHQREYQRAAELLDTIDWAIGLNQYEADIILLKTERWYKLTQVTEDDLLRGVVYYNLTDYHNAIKYLSQPSAPYDYRMLYLAKAYYNLNYFEHSLKVLLAIHSISSYLFDEYQDLLFNVLLNIEDFDIVQRELIKLKDPSLREFILLKMYETQKDKKNTKKIAWNLIENYQRSQGAYYALQVVQPKTQSQHKMHGMVYYYHSDYDKALWHLKKSASSNEVNYYRGYIYYKKGEHANALKYLASSTWAQAYYYRGRIYENLYQYDKAIAIYDSLYTHHRGSSYATRGFKRKAFLWEDLGDTLKAVETFLKINERNTKFRAAMNLYKVGKLNEATGILNTCEEPEFVYWHIRVRERLGEPVESLKHYLTDTYPLSYYSLVRHSNTTFFDTTSLVRWIKQLGDSTSSLSHADSLHLARAIRYFRLGELQYATEELDMISASGPNDLLYLTQLCAHYGADRQSIIYALRLKEIAENNHVRKMPIEMYRLLYPVRYALSIMDQDVKLSLCLAMIWQESLFDPGALSPARAQGLMQIIPETAKRISRELDIPSYSLNDVYISIKFGCYYFNKMFDNFNSIPLSLAAYNAGPMRVTSWLAKNPNSEIDEFIELIPFEETKNYVKYVLGRQVIYEILIEH